jgi:hypothetical protein
VPAGYLAERSETKGGHTITRFYGRPSSWMSQSAPQGRAHVSAQDRCQLSIDGSGGT